MLVIKTMVQMTTNWILNIIIIVINCIASSYSIIAVVIKVKLNTVLMYNYTCIIMVMVQ